MVAGLCPSAAPWYGGTVCLTVGSGSFPEADGVRGCWSGSTCCPPPGARLVNPLLRGTHRRVGGFIPPGQARRLTVANNQAGTSPPASLVSHLFQRTSPGGWRQQRGTRDSLRLQRR